MKRILAEIRLFCNREPGEELNLTKLSIGVAVAAKVPGRLLLLSICAAGSKDLLQPVRFLIR